MLGNSGTKPKKLKTYTTTVVVCGICGKHFRKRESEIKQHVNYYCSKQCANKARADRNDGFFFHTND